MTKRHYRQHGLAGAKKLMREYGSRSLDGRTSAAKALAQWREAVVEDLGGPDAISAMQATLIDEASKLKMLLHGVDSWLLSLDRPPVDKRERKMWRVVKDTMPLRNSLIQIMTALGLERRRPPAQDLSAYVEQTYGNDRPGGAPRPQTGVEGAQSDGVASAISSSEDHIGRSEE